MVPGAHLCWQVLLLLLNKAKLALVAVPLAVQLLPLARWEGWAGKGRGACVSGHNSCACHPCRCLRQHGAAPRTFLLQRRLVLLIIHRLVGVHRRRRVRQPRARRRQGHARQTAWRLHGLRPRPLRSLAVPRPVPPSRGWHPSLDERGVEAALRWPPRGVTCQRHDLRRLRRSNSSWCRRSACLQRKRVAWRHRAAMATRRLARTGLDDATVLHLSARNINTAKELLDCTSLDVSELLDCSEADAAKIILCVRACANTQQARTSSRHCALALIPACCASIVQACGGGGVPGAAHLRAAMGETGD